MSSKFITHINENLEKWLITIFTGLFMFIVLYIYKGYNIEQTVSYSGHSLFFRAITHSIATSLLFFISEFYIRPYFKINTNKKYLIWIIGIILIGTNITFLLFNYFWSWTEWSWKSYLLFYYEYPLIIFLPIIIANLIGKERKKSTINNENLLVFLSENGKSNFKIKPEQLLYLQSSDNYVEIYYVLEGKMKKHLIRNSLKAIEKNYTASPYLVRCHRSFMVNPKNIDHIVQNAKVTNLNMFNSSIPVSKTYLVYFQ